jgi:hypothetical protein
MHAVLVVCDAGPGVELHLPLHQEHSLWHAALSSSSWLLLTGPDCWQFQSDMQ